MKFEIEKNTEASSSEALHERRPRSSEKLFADFHPALRRIEPLRKIERAFRLREIERNDYSGILHRAHAGTLFSSVRLGE